MATTKRLTLRTDAPKNVTPKAIKKNKTPTELAHERKLAEKRKRELSKTAIVTHKQKVQQFNEKLAKLSEHHDIPKV